MARDTHPPISPATPTTKETTGTPKVASKTPTVTIKNQTNQKEPGRCMRPGPIQRNPYLNFLREYRKKCLGLSAVETIRQGAKAWKSLPAEEKSRYIVQAFYIRKRKRKQSHIFKCLVGHKRVRKSRKQKARSKRATARMC